MRAGALLVGILVLFNTASAQVDVPLVVENVAPGVQRIAVRLAIGNADPQLVLLDTGSSILLFSSDVALPSSAANLGQSGRLSYGINANDTFDFDTYLDSVSFTDVKGNVLLTVPDVAFGKTTAGNPAEPFKGIMGAGPSVDSFSDSKGGPVFSLYSILASVEYPGGGILPGFTIALRRDGAGGTLTIGIDPAKWANVPDKYPMTPKNSDEPDFPNFPSYDGDQLTLAVSASGRSASPVTFSGGNPMLVKLDTGDPTVSIVLDSADYAGLGADYLAQPGGSNSDLLAGSNVSLDGDDAGFDLAITTLSTSPTSGNAEIVDPPASYIHVNTGIQPFNDYAITFVFDDGTGKGWVGFQPLPFSKPEVFVKKHWSTRHPAIRIHGASSSGTTGVLYRAKGDRKWRKAEGLAPWNFRARLDRGKNVFQVRALGANAQSQPVRVIVRRTKR